MSPLDLGSPRSRPGGHYSAPPRPSVLCSAKTAHCPSCVASLLTRSPVPCPLPSLCVPSFLRLADCGETRRQRQGSWSAGTPTLPALHGKETLGSPKSPSYPCEYMPRSQTPVAPSSLALLQVRTAAFRTLQSVGFPSPRAGEFILLNHDYTYLGAQPRGLHSRYSRHRTPHC